MHSRLMLLPTNEIAPDGFQFMLTMKGHDSHKAAADEKLVVKYISELVGQVNVRKVPFLSTYRSAVFHGYVDQSYIVVSPNVRMVNKFGHGRVFIVGGNAHCLVKSDFVH